MLKDSMIILKKELRRIFTDRRLLFMLVVLPLVMLPLMYSFMGRANRSRQSDIAQYRSRVAVLVPDDSELGAEAILEALYEMNTDIFFINENELDSAMVQVTGKDLELLIVFPPGMDTAQDASSFDITAYHNSTADYSEFALEQFTFMLSILNDSLVKERIAEHGLSPEILSALTVNASMEPGAVDLAGEGSLMGKIIGMMVPFFIVIYLFANAMKVGLDSVAGEKERGTLAVLLVNQVGRLSIVLGKMMSVMTAAIVGAVSSAIGLKIASRYLIDMVSTGGETVADYTMNTMDFLQFGVLVIPLAVLISSIVLLVSTFAKNVKEGQGIVMPVYLLIMVMGMTTMQSGDIAPHWMRLTPVFNTLAALKDIFMKTAVWGDILFAMGTSLFLSAVLIFITLRMFNNERILFRV